MFTGDFRRDFEALLSESDKAPYAFVRFADGEYHVLLGKRYRAEDPWQVTEERPSWLQTPLLDALHYEGERFFVGISSPCCQYQAWAWYTDQLRRRARWKVSYASVFGFQNHRRFPEFRKKFQDAVLVGCSPKCEVRVPRDGVSGVWDLDAVVERLIELRRPVLLAAGPCSNVIAHQYWLRVPAADRRSIVDVGAVLDRELFGKVTRSYLSAGGPREGHACSWSAGPAGAVGPGVRTGAAVRGEPKNAVRLQSGTGRCSGVKLR